MSTERVAAILASGDGHLDALRAAALAGPRGGWLGAGFVRNAVWDVLSGRVPRVADLADLDLVYFDEANGTAGRDAAFEAALRAARPGLRWSVVNQVRMAPREAPYRDLPDALARWPETATAIAARLAGGRIEVMAPHGFDDLLGRVVRPTPAHAADPAAVRARLAAKGWAARWPELRLVGLAGDWPARLAAAL